MSASNKKKLRSEEGAAKLTERQLAEQKEAKKLKLYTVLFAVVLVVLIAVAVVVSITRSIEASGVHEKNTIAATVGDHKISNAELSYYYIDAINNFNNNYGSYAFLYGIDTSKPLDQQVIDEATGETWADNFIQSAVNSAQAVYAMNDAAKAEGFTLTDDQRAQVDSLSSTLDAYATLSGAENVDAYVKSMYGNGTSKASYLEYYERNLLASAYQNAHQDSLVYTDAQLREADDADPTAYSSYNYNQYYLSVSKFLTGGTTAEDGTTTYTDEEKAAAAEAAKVAADTLTDASITTVEELDAAIAALEVNADAAASSTAYSNQSYNAVNSYLTEWVTDASRQSGDVTAIPVNSVSTDENGNEVESLTAYYICFFNGVEKNDFPMVNVRHILVSFSGETNEDGTYTDEAKAAAKATADEIMNEWKSGDANEDSFAELANQKSTDSGSNSNGGLYENVYPGQMVPAFNDWCFDSSRKVGDTDIVETNYGYHIMYFSGNTEETYRDHMIADALRNNDMETWYLGLLDGTPVVNGDTAYIRTNIVLGSK